MPPKRVLERTANDGRDHPFVTESVRFPTVSILWMQIPVAQWLTRLSSPPGSSEPGVPGSSTVVTAWSLVSGDSAPQSRALATSDQSQLDSQHDQSHR